MFLKPCATKLFVSIFDQLEAGIHNAISGFKWRKLFKSM